MTKTTQSITISSRIIPLMLAVMFLAATSVKADYLLSDKSGKIDHQFSTDDNGGYIKDNSYTYSQKFKLDDPNWFFTSFSLTPENVMMAVQSYITNGFSSKPEIDLSAGADGIVKWTGKVVVTSDKGALYETGASYTQDILDITYDPGIIPGGVNGYAKSDEFPINFDDLSSLGVILGEDVLKESQWIQFDFIMSDINFNTDFNGDGLQGRSQYWEGSVGGLLQVSYDTSSSTATPEPASLLICGLGIAGAGLVGSRKRRVKK